MSTNIYRGFNDSDALQEFPEMTSEDFKALFRHHPGGVALITADDGNGPVALTATSVASVSAEPPTLMFSVSTMSSSASTLRNAKTVVVHLIDGDSLHLAKLGAASGIDRFANSGDWFTLATGEPVFRDAPAWVHARILQQVEVEGATVFIVEGVHVNASADELIETRDDREGLVYMNRCWHRISRESEI